MRTIQDASDRLGMHRYPTTRDELLAAHGDMEIEFSDGSETLAEILGRLDSETYDSHEEATAAMYSAVSSMAIGRKYYSDRDPFSPGTDGRDQTSL
ncbi:DUF2795 domain-containing protein [Halorhabdus sp. CBA1104]|uniref:DUF5789 family protein n=1 Tax=Halorhabdus sp. CBA1104 TaxID=1380432 RepID=UPI0012B3A7A2|nr:DUF2795 domain-containing protein [Halorhabdus sp. CBA1104]QGN05928.1 DUF2795 domain-containing protein [Halorhabdus sp. CBA1104]